jgi:surface protein
MENPIEATEIYGLIEEYNVSNVTDMNGMFHNAREFNQDIGSWNVSIVTNMSYMFCDAHEFLQNISQWNVINVMCINNIIDNTKLSLLLNKHHLDNASCFDTKAMAFIFAYGRRKSFVHFLVENGFEPFGQQILIKNKHQIFDIHDINYHIMSFV